MTYYAANFIEMTYPGPLGMDYGITTQMGIPGKRQPNPLSGLLRLGIPLVILGGIIVFIIKR